MEKQQICILGSTGSIGTQALDVIAQHGDRYEVYALTANSRWQQLAQQARRFSPAAVVIADDTYYNNLREALADLPDIKVYAGSKALDEIVEAAPIDMVLTAMVGYAGLSPTIHAIRARKKICLANKETLVVAGELICSLAQQHRVPILPVDSEHSAIFQSLVGEGDNEVEKLLLTCSGGPFRNFSHIDSATLMNKGFEVIEARWLFGVPAEKIQVLVHPQSIVHSAVQFCDGSVKAQLGVPDMRLPIQYAFSFPERLHLDGDRLDLFRAHDLQFIEPDMQKFRCLQMAYESLRQGGNMPCIVNAANEVANEAFRKGLCAFPEIADSIEKTMLKATFSATADYDTYVASDAEARRVAAELLHLDNNIKQ